MWAFSSSSMSLNRLKNETKYYTIAKRSNEMDREREKCVSDAGQQKIAHPPPNTQPKANK